jgi:glycosyltransferase involved in cell wall biosynthesis
VAKRLTVLNVAYPFAPVGPDATGGAEQVLSALDRALVLANHRSLVVGCTGSQTAGTLLATGPLPELFDEDACRRSHKLHRLRIEEALREWPIDVVHCHGHDFAKYLPPLAVPTLVTLHLPADHYPPAALSAGRPELYFNCVSASQKQSFPFCEAMLPEIPNGIPVAQLLARHAKRRFALALGRICPEKGFHHALDAAALAQIPLVIAGQIFPYAAHERYFDAEIRPRLGKMARFVGPLGFARKRRFLTAARCLVMSSLVPETSSLVAMEAIACGTPVVAYRAGALPDIIEPAITGFIVDDRAEMAEAIRAVDSIDRERCRAIARQRFTQDRMIEAYIRYYRNLAAQRRPLERWSA